MANLGKGQFAIGQRLRLVAVVAQVVDQQLCDARIVFHHQNAACRVHALLPAAGCCEA